MQSDSGLGLPVLVSLCGSLLGKNTRGGTIIVGALNLGGSIETIPNATRIAELTHALVVACIRMRSTPVRAQRLRVKTSSRSSEFLVRQQMILLWPPFYSHRQSAKVLRLIECMFKLPCNRDLVIRWAWLRKHVPRGCREVEQSRNQLFRKG